MIYRLKEGLGSPDRYLGGFFEKAQLKDGRVVGSKKFVDYLKSTIKDVDK